MILFKSVKRLRFMKGFTNDGTIFSSGTSTWIQIIRKASGLMEKKNDLLEVSDDLTFTGFLRQRQEEARRSIIIQISNQELWDSLFQLCNNCGYVKKIFHYTERRTPFVLLEMLSEETLSDFLKKNHEISSTLECCTPFFSMRKDTIHLENNIQKNMFSNNLPTIMNEKLTKLEMGKQLNETDTLSRIYTDLSLNDLGVRLRFLMCRQLETFCAGFLPSTIAYPFGSSVTGFGVNNCDLDIALVPLPSDSSYFEQENFLGMNRLTIQEHITAIAELMKTFLVGCSSVTLIRNAKVPIVKYKNYFTNVECDLSLYNLHGVVMSQLLYTLSSIDSRVKPLIIALKLWANSNGLVNKAPAKTLSNFGLSLLVIFFLQYTHLLPSWNFFPRSDGFLIDETHLKSLVNKFRLKAKEDTRSLGELYKEFFKFYSAFDFNRYGICLNSGNKIKNQRRYPLYIENPLIKGINVSVNVGTDEVRKLHHIFNAVSNNIEKSKLSDIYQQNSTE